jgi:hypothetical protein
LGSFLGFKSGTWILLLVFGFFSVFGSWFMFVFPLICCCFGCCGCLPTHRCTVRNLARGYAESLGCVGAFPRTRDARLCKRLACTVAINIWVPYFTPKVRFPTNVPVN